MASLLANFRESIDYELLKQLIEEYEYSFNLTEDELIERLVSLMKEIFEERYNATNPA